MRSLLYQWEVCAKSIKSLVLLFAVDVEKGGLMFGKCRSCFGDAVLCFGLVSLFNGISNVTGYSMLNPSL